MSLGYMVFISSGGVEVFQWDSLLERLEIFAILSKLKLHSQSTHTFQDVFMIKQGTSRQFKIARRNEKHHPNHGPNLMMKIL